jgi:hypothetical protein
MDVAASLLARCATARLFPFVDDLGVYPQWMALVHRAEPDGDDVWRVELRARVGPLTRSKRLRMRRTVRDLAAGRVRFERDEDDGRRHSPWVLDASISEPSPGHSRLDMTLHYGGGLWTGGVLERVLAEHITGGRDRLLALVASSA